MVCGPWDPARALLWIISRMNFLSLAQPMWQDHPQETSEILRNERQSFGGHFEWWVIINKYGTTDTTGLIVPSIIGQPRKVDQGVAAESWDPFVGSLNLRFGFEECIWEETAASRFARTLFLLLINASFPLAGLDRKMSILGSDSNQKSIM